MSAGRYLRLALFGHPTLPGISRHDETCILTVALREGQLSDLDKIAIVGVPCLNSIAIMTLRYLLPVFARTPIRSLFLDLRAIPLVVKTVLNRAKSRPRFFPLPRRFRRGLDKVTQFLITIRQIAALIAKLVAADDDFPRLIDAGGKAGLEPQLHLV